MRKARLAARSSRSIRAFWRSPLGILQGIGYLILFETQNVLPHLSAFAFTENVIIVTAGSILLMWLGELVSEFGIGNGV